MKLIIELSENDYKALKEDGVQNHLALADTIIAHSMPYDPQGDLISREALKDIWALYKKYQPRLATNVYEFGEALRELIDTAPTVEERSYAMGYQDGLEDGLQDIRPEAKWIFSRCDNCGAYHNGKYRNYCPNCGAAMKGGGTKCEQ